MSFLSKVGSAFLYIGKEVFEVLKDKVEQADKIQKSSNEDLKKIASDRRTTQLEKNYANKVLERRKIEEKERKEQKKRERIQEEKDFFLERKDEFFK